jgi:hypothetical protein
MKNSARLLFSQAAKTETAMPMGAGMSMQKTSTKFAKTAIPIAMQYSPLFRLT